MARSLCVACYCEGEERKQSLAMVGIFTDLILFAENVLNSCIVAVPVQI